jgi:hypothetical protein
MNPFDERSEARRLGRGACGAYPLWPVYVELCPRIEMLRGPVTEASRAWRSGQRDAAAGWLIPCLRHMNKAQR